jgi:poly-beta-hydroxyalkanoate depolymerase
MLDTQVNERLCGVGRPAGDPARHRLEPGGGHHGVVDGRRWRELMPQEQEAL